MCVCVRMRLSFVFVCGGGRGEGGLIGTVIFADGRKYDGVFKDGLPNSMGMLCVHVDGS